MTLEGRDELDAAITRLYEVFGGYAAPAEPEFCEHCVSPEEDAVLRSTPLRQLSANDLNKYSFKALSTWGGVGQFKHLLPRLFEVAANEGFGYDAEILFKKPHYAGFLQWPQEEQEALRSYCEALWQYALAHHPIENHLPVFSVIDECLCSIGQLMDDLKPLLELWKPTSQSHTLHLADFATVNAAHLLANRRLLSPFWDDRPVQMAQVVNWFLAHDFSAISDLAELGALPRKVAAELAEVVKRPGTE